MRSAATLVALAGCAVGAGGTTVGEWQAKRVVESTACIEREPGVCGKIVEIGSDQPARSFRGGMFTFSAPGYARAQGESAFLLDGSYEYLRGRGRFALAGRVGLTLIDGTQHSWIVTPVTLIGHAGGAWGSVFAGVGYAPLAMTSQTGAAATYAHDGVGGLLGTRIVLRRDALDRSLTVSPELRVQLVGDATILSLTANLGLHL